MMLFSETILKPFLKTVLQFGDRNAFYIDGTYYTYNDFARRINAIRHRLKGCSHQAVGLVTNDDIDTYASIFSLWMEGCHYVPLHPSWPIDRCMDIISQVEIDTILDSSETSRYPTHVLPTVTLTSDSQEIAPVVACDDKEFAYILFTSGSTGKPKGVPVSRGNLSAFVNSFWDMGLDLHEEDRCLQCFELTFDLSVFSYLVPLLRGACVYTVPSHVIKYSYISELLEDHALTVALMAPSTINYLRPYFDEVEAPGLKYSLFCGEALHEDVTREWAACVPQARIFNVYGPTEDTIFCTYYEYQRHQDNKSHNGVLSIGRSMTSGTVKILNEEGTEVGPGELGELVLSGQQLFSGYWKNEEKTREVFLTHEGQRFYKSGDLCYYDADGDIMYSGRKDFQTKIQGFRVELGEIEFHAREFLNDMNVVCVALENSQQLTEIALFIESREFDTTELVSRMREKMPSYMIPTKILFEPVFPLNINGKIDRKALKAKL